VASLAPYRPILQLVWRATAPSP